MRVPDSGSAAHTDAILIDSHLHLWSLGDDAPEWLTPASGALYDTFTPERAAGELRIAGVRSAVVVQSTSTLSETYRMLDLADVHEWIAGVVGWVPLERDGVVRSAVGAWQRHPAFAGVRPSWPAGASSAWLDSEGVRASLGELARRSLTLDIPDAWPEHLPGVAALAGRFPELSIVIDHLGKPPRGEPTFGAWHDAIGRVAAHANTSAKLSGLFRPGLAHTAGALREVFEIALESFGADRLMWGSDWPITVALGGYLETLAVLRELIATLSPAEQCAIESGTVASVYSLRG